MSTINFYLERPDRKKLHPVMLYYRKGKLFKYYTKVKISSEGWDAKRQQVKKNIPAANEYNAVLESLKETIRQIEREALFNKKFLSVESIKHKFEQSVGKHKSTKDFHTLFEQYLDQSKVTKTHGTVKGLYSSYAKLKLFEKEKKFPLSFDTMNKTFYDAYLAFLIQDCNHLNNTVGRFIKALKFFLNYATESGLNTNLEFKKFKVLQEEVDLIHHSDIELQKLLYLPINDQSLHNTRENYCFACVTGLRFSDINNLKDVNIENEQIKIWTIKTKNAISVPLNQYAKEIIERNKGKFIGRPIPPCYALQKMNVFLKDLGRLAELNDLTQVVKYSGSRRIDSLHPKHELMSFHAARRTFITLSLEKGMRPEVVMQIVGIKKWETFKRYIKITEQIKIIEMNNKWNNSFQLKAV